MIVRASRSAGGRMRAMSVCLIFLAIAVACSAAIDQSENGRMVLMDYFRALNDGRYADAAGLYGGSYQALREMNPDLPADSYAALWERGCQVNGLQCLPVLSATFKEQVGSTYIYNVEFKAADGGRFVLGPCCGEDPASTTPVHRFEYRVELADGKYRVMDLPPLLP